MIAQSCQLKQSCNFSLSVMCNKVKTIITTFITFYVLCSCNCHSFKLCNVLTVWHKTSSYLLKTLSYLLKNQNHKQHSMRASTHNAREIIIVMCLIMPFRWFWCLNWSNVCQLYTFQPVSYLQQQKSINWMLLTMKICGWLNKTCGLKEVQWLVPE